MGTQENIPNFICIGAQRAGTTWLHECLKEHPEVYLPEEKELHFFDRFYENGFQWYLTKFTDAKGKLCGEITPNYYQVEGSLERIKKDLPQVKIIYILREPISRARSQFQLFSESRFKNKTLNEVLEIDPVVSDLSMQGKHLKKLNSLFKREQILVLFYDELANAPENFLKKVYKFLMIDNSFTPLHLNKRMNRIVLPGLQEKLRKLGLGWLIESVKKSPLSGFIKEHLHNNKQSNITTKNNHSSSLYTRFHRDIEIIEDELDINLSHWKK